MDTISLCIIVEDRDYGGALARAIAGITSGFTVDQPDPDHWRDMDQRLDRWDVFLVDPVTLQSDLLSGRRDRTLVLYDGFSEEAPGEWPAADKYRGLSGILTAVRLVFAGSTGRPHVPHISGGIPGQETWPDQTGRSILRENPRVPEILSFLSPEGGAGVSCIALAAARELTRYRDKKVLFLSMEPILSAGLCPAPAEGRGDISACLYHFLRGRREQLGRLGDAFLYRDPYGVARFAPGSGFNPLRELDEKDFSEFLMAMMADEGWDHLILDWGSAFDRLMACWLPHSARIIGIHREDSVKGLDPQTWAGRLKESLHLDEKKMITVVNFAGGGEGEPSGRSLPDAVRIPRDCGDFKRAAAGVEISLTNAFGMGIKALTDRICGVHTKEEKGCNEQDYTFKARNVGWNHLSDGWEL